MAVVGGTVLALGVVCIVLPGPAFLVIPAGLAILAIEFAWARRWLTGRRAGGGPRVHYLRGGRAFAHPRRRGHVATAAISRRLYDPRKTLNSWNNRTGNGTASFQTMDMGFAPSAPSNVTGPHAR